MIADIIIVWYIEASLQCCIVAYSAAVGLDGKYIIYTSRAKDIYLYILQLLQ